jgi:hypothetical protein
MHNKHVVNIMAAFPTEFLLLPASCEVNWLFVNWVMVLYCTDYAAQMYMIVMTLYHTWNAYLMGLVCYTMLQTKILCLKDRTGPYPVAKTKVQTYLLWTDSHS